MISFGRVPKWVVPAIGYTIAVASLVWVLLRFPYRQLGDHLRTMNWAWVVLAVGIEISVYFVDAWRWKVLLGPAGAPSFRLCLQAVFIGLFANDVLPLRAGEVVRCFLLSYETDVLLSLAIVSDAVVRVMDGVWIVILYLLVTFQIGRHGDVTLGMWLFGAAVVSASAGILFILFRRRHAYGFIRSRSWAARFEYFLDEVHRLAHWRELGLAALGTGAYWVLQAAAFWALAQGDSFDFGLGAAVFVIVVRTLGTFFPGAPGNVGTYQAAVVIALKLLLTENANAEIFAEIAFAVLTLPPLACGAIAIATAGLDIGDLHRHAHRAHESERRRWAAQQESR